MSSSRGLKEVWWPEIADRQRARKVARQAFWAAIFVVGVTVLFATLAAFGNSVAGIGPAAYLDAAMFGALALGIWKMSRVAAVAGLVLFVFEKVWMWQSNHATGSVFVAIALAIAFANGVRATFAYHSLAGEERKPIDSTPLVPR